MGEGGGYTMKQQFINFNLRKGSLAAIKQANDIIATYLAQGYRLTLRQLYYQHVARDLIPNTEKSYKNLGQLINKGRLAGLIDWSAIEDRTRNLRGLAHWDSPVSRILSASQTYRLEKWDNQPNRIEVWVEKDALVGILQRVCNRHDVDYFSCRGYVSQSEMYGAAQRLNRYIQDGQNVVILHLGDHDPSGMDMTRDIIDRLLLFMDGVGDAEVNRLALNWEQIELYNPPPNPAKTTDARFQGYADEYGTESWELDALEPSVIESLIEDHILAYRDEALWREMEEEEKHHKELLYKVAGQWDEVEAFLSDSQ